METRNQKTFTKLIEERGKAEFVKNKAGHLCAVFADGSIAFVSAKAAEMMLSGNTNKDDYQFAEVQCTDGSWCPTVMPRNKSNILFSIE